MKLVIALVTTIITYSSMACPQLNLSQLTCVSDRGVVKLDLFSLQGNMLTLGANGERLQISLPMSETTDGITWGWKCRGQSIIDWQFIAGEMVEVSWQLQGDKLISEGFIPARFICDNSACTQQSGLVKEFVRTECTF